MRRPGGLLVKRSLCSMMRFRFLLLKLSLSVVACGGEVWMDAPPAEPPPPPPPPPPVVLSPPPPPPSPAPYLPYDSGLFPTGVDAAGLPLPPNSVDPHYTLSSSDPQFPGPDAIVVKPAGPLWTLPNATSMWVSIQTGGVGANATYTYTTTFAVEFDPTAATLSGLVACDDECVVMLNGIQVAALPVPGWKAMHLLTIPAGSPFQLGTNTLTFAVRNLAWVTGLGVFALSGTVCGPTGKCAAKMSPSRENGRKANAT